jgi:hypothetical protein
MMAVRTNRGRGGDWGFSTIHKRQITISRTWEDSAHSETIHQSNKQVSKERSGPGPKEFQFPNKILIIYKKYKLKYIYIYIN